MQPDKDTMIQKLLQENATLTLVKVQLESLIEQYQDKEKENGDTEDEN
jgi:hypothetical protein